MYGSEPWYELYRGSKPLIVGHRDYLGTGQPFIYQDRVFGLDTGCCHGGTLTGLLLPNFEVVSVCSRQDYWTELKREYRAVSQRGPSVNRHAQDETKQRVLNQLADSIQRAHERIWAQLSAEPSFNELSPQAQGKIYAAHIRHLAPILQYWLHLARRGELAFDALRASHREASELRVRIEQLSVRNQR